MSKMTSIEKLGEATFHCMEKINSELLSMMYGTLVIQLLKDLEQIDAVNEHLEQMGYNIGIRLVEEYLARCGRTTCSKFKDTADAIAKAAFKMFLGITADVEDWNAEGTSCSLLFYENPLTDFVELPPTLYKLSYSNILCGVIRGALEQLQMKVECYFEKDMLKGDDCYRIKLELKQILREEFIDDEI